MARTNMVNSPYSRDDGRVERGEELNSIVSAPLGLDILPTDRPITQSSFAMAPEQSELLSKPSLFFSLLFLYPTDR